MPKQHTSKRAPSHCIRSGHMRPGADAAPPFSGVSFNIQRLKFMNIDFYSICYRDSPT